VSLNGAEVLLKKETALWEIEPKARTELRLNATALWNCSAKVASEDRGRFRVLTTDSLSAKVAAEPLGNIITLWAGLDKATAEILGNTTAFLTRSAKVVSEERGRLNVLVTTSLSAKVAAVLLRKATTLWAGSDRPAVEVLGMPMTFRNWSARVVSEERGRLNPFCSTPLSPRVAAELLRKVTTL